MVIDSASELYVEELSKFKPQLILQVCSKSDTNACH